jgi:signal transduction histidine kinase
LGVIITLNALLALALGSWLVTRPFAKLVAKARQVGSGNLTVPVRFTRRDEIGDLAHEMDRMSDSLLEAKVNLQSEELARRKAEEELRHAERLATIGKLAAGVAHELGTPLNVISGRAARLARKHEHDSETNEEVSIIRNQVDRVTRIIQQLLHFARRRKASKSKANLLELTRSTVADVEPTLSPSVHVSLQLDDEANSRLQLDAGQIRQVLTNLIVNAAQAMPTGGPLSVSLSKQWAQPPSGSAKDRSEFFCLSVEDHGGGISPDDLPHIFEPFFTTKDIGEGTGLGLAVAHGIVIEHGGWIGVDTESGKGTRFTVYLPGAQS